MTCDVDDPSGWIAKKELPDSLGCPHDRQAAGATYDSCRRGSPRGSDFAERAEEAVTNLRTDDVEAAREFFQLFGLTEVEMNQGWVARFVAPDSGACVQVVTRDATAPHDSVMTLKVDDVDAAYETARERDLDIVHPITNEPWGVRRFFVRSPDGHVINIAQHG